MWSKTNTALYHGETWRRQRRVDQSVYAKIEERKRKKKKKTFFNSLLNLWLNLSLNVALCNYCL